MGGVFSVPWIVLYLVLIGFLLAVGTVDIRTHTIPNQLPLAILCVGLIAHISMLSFPSPDISSLERILGALLCSTPFFVGAMLGAQIGGGDMKLMVSAGYVLGARFGLLALFLGSLFGALCALWLRHRRDFQPKDSFAYGPPLCLGIGLAPLVGQAIFTVF